MILSKRAVGGSHSRPFVQGRQFISIRRDIEPRQWVLTNSSVSFTFIEDKIKGVRLASWISREASEDVVTNVARSLWQLNILRQYKVTSTKAIAWDYYSLYPVLKHFSAPSLIPTVEADGTKYFLFQWQNVPYDARNPTFTCNVHLYATLRADSETLDLSLRVFANQSYTSEVLSNFRSAIVMSLSFPSLAFSKSSDENVNNNTVFTNSIGFGTTISNPNKYLRTPRYAEESFHYRHEGARLYHTASVGSDPTDTFQRANHSTPGNLSIPAVVYGRRDTKVSTLIYGMDLEGTNPKCFQWYCDDRNFHFRTYHNSDHQVDPYGVGGYTNSSSSSSEGGQNYSVSNIPTWSLRIRPYKSPSRWVDWYGFKIYKDEAVAEQIQAGWLPDSFYNRYQAGTLTLASAEMPMIMNNFGYTSGDLSNAVRAAAIYRDIYRNSITPPISGDIIIPIHTQNVTNNYAPHRGTGQYDFNNNYYGWENWAGSGLGINWGPESYKAPDFSVINRNYRTSYAEMMSEGDLPYHFLITPFVLSTGSSYVTGLSGIDLVGRGLQHENDRTTNDNYRAFAYSGNVGEVSHKHFYSCYATQPYQDFAETVGRAHAQQGAGGCYWDTWGNYSKGCLAKDHTYYSTGQYRYITESHPRGDFTRYFIRKQLDWVDRWNSGALPATPGNWLQRPGDPGFLLGKSSEFITDTNLSRIPISLTYSFSPSISIFANKITAPRPDALSNNHFGLPIDSYTDAEVATLLSLQPATYWTCNIFPPNWSQRCPAFMIAHSDKAILNDFSAVYATNSYPQFFTEGVITGRGAYGQLLRGEYSTGGLHELRRRMDWASFAMLQWPYSNRMSVWHVENDLGVVNTVYGQIEENENIVFYSGVWSGYTENLVKKMFRIQAYNPDYLYHGTMEHPLDNWITSTGIGNTFSALLRGNRNPNLASITGLYTGDEKAIHMVRRHRENENILLVIGNWFSGSATFSGEFDPLSYDIENGYQVYTLDVNSSAHGERTLTTIVEPGEPFNFSVTLGEYDYKIYEFNVNSLLDNEAFVDLRTDYSPIRYSYDIIELLSNQTNVIYSYGTSIFGELLAPLEGYRAPSTQQILNNLPDWMKLRQNFNSRGWKFANAWGMSFDNTLENTTKNVTDLNLATTDSTYLSRLNSTEITSTELLEPREPRNLLFNSAFSIRDVARVELPAGWQQFDAQNSSYIDYRKSAISPCSITSDTGIIKVGQQIVLNNISVQKFMASLYILCNASTVDVKLHVSVERIDGTTTSHAASLQNRSSEWLRLVLPIDVNAQVYRVIFSVHANCSGVVSIAAPQLENLTLTTWGKSVVDSFGFFNAVYSLSLEPDPKKVPIFSIPTEQAFIDVGIPTRVAKIIRPTKDLAPYTSQAFGRKVSQLGEVIRTEFAILEDQVIERALSPTPWDIFGRYDIKDLRFHENLEYGTVDDASVTITPLATAIRKDWLFVACRETYLGSTYRTLKIVKPRTPPNGEEYLESITDFNLDLNFDTIYGANQITDEEIFSISFSDVDPNYMVITTTNNIKYYYRLYFDYYYFNTNKNRLYTLEAYENAKLIVI